MNKKKDVSIVYRFLTHTIIFYVDHEIGNKTPILALK